MSADPLSDILHLTRARSMTTGGFTAGGPWAIRFPAPHTIKFFAVLRGGCWLVVDGEPAPRHFTAGDVGLLAARREFTLASDPALPAIPAMELFAGAGKAAVRIGDGADFSHLGGHVLLDPATGGLLADVLPPCVHVRAAAPQAPAMGWLIDQLVQERAANRPGAPLAAAQLSQLLFIHVLRNHMAEVANLPPGWLRALNDPRLAPALCAMHADPAHDWHLPELARACAMSRTSFALGFRLAAGVAPLAYLASWRMRLAGQALREGDSTVSEIALSVGYASESAFSTAFKRETGQSPRGYRLATRTAAAQPAGKAA